MNKSIDYEDDIIIISDNEDNDSNFNFCEVDNEEVNNKIDLKDYDLMIATDHKKNWRTIESIPTTISTPKIKSTPIIKSLSSIKMAHTIESMNIKSIDYENDIIFISDDEDDDSNFNFKNEIKNEIYEINKIDLKDYESMIFTDLKKNWPTILKKMSDPLTGNKVI